MKKYIEMIKELYKKPYGKAVLFFGFYLIFFVIIAVAARIGGRTSLDVKYDKETITGITTNELKNYNYSFDYKVVLDDTTYSYVGSKESSKFNYTYNGKEYYNDKTKSYIKEEDWKEVDNPIKLNKFFNEINVDRVLENSYIESKTTYDSGDTTYNLLVSSNTLNKLIDEKETDYDEAPNKIIVSIDKDNYIKEINYNLNSYCKMRDDCNSLSLTIKYTNYSNVN